MSICQIGSTLPPIFGECPPGQSPPTTVVIGVTPYKPGEPTLPPPVEGKPVGVPTLPPTTSVTLLEPISSPDPCGDFSTDAVCAAYQAAHPPQTFAETVVAKVPHHAQQLPATGSPTGVLVCVAIVTIVLGRSMSKFASKRPNGQKEG